MRASGIPALFLLLFGCQASAATGENCARNSECADALVCVDGRCRDECVDARDCTTGDSCVRYRGAGVCLPPAQPVPCVFSSDCGALFCRSGHCVQQCTTDHDCDFGTCDGSQCTQPVQTTPATDAGPFGDAGARCQAGQTLCRTDARCHDLSMDPSACGQCGVVCPSGGACEAGACVCGGMPCAPSNDRCSGALPIALGADGTGSAMAAMAGARQDLATCGGLDGADVFYTVHLDQRAVLAAIAFEPYAPDILDQGCGAPPTECGTLCSAHSDGTWDVAVAGPGDVVVAVRTSSSTTLGSAQLQLRAIPIGDMPVTRLGRGAIVGGEHPTATEMLGAEGVSTGCGAGQAHGFYWIDCTLGQLTATLCATGVSGLVLESRARGECIAADATGCVTHDSVAGTNLEMFVAHGAGGSVTFDAAGR